MERSPSQVLLKVFSGPHLGAEMLLADGRHSVGSDDACDLVLVDPLIKERHATLVVSGGNVTVEAAENESIVVDGQATNRTALKPFQFFTLGTTHLATGPARESWPTLAPPVSTSTPVAVPPAVGATTSTAAEPRPEAREKPSVQPTKPVVVGRRRRRGVAAALVALAAMIALFLALFPPGTASTAASPVSPTEHQPQVNQLLAEYSKSSELKSEVRGGVLTVSGYVPDSAVRRELTTRLAEISSSIRASVLETSALAESVGRVLKMNQLDLKAAAGGPGEVIVSGDVADASRWTRAKVTLAKDVPRVRQLTDRVNVKAPAQQQAAPTIPVNVTPAVVANDPPISSPPEPPTAEITAESAAPVAPGVTIPIRSVTVGQRRWIILESGQKVLEGGRLPGGPIVKSISADRVVLDHNGQQSTVLIGAGKP